MALLNGREELANKACLIRCGLHDMIRCIPGSLERILLFVSSGPALGFTGMEVFTGRASEILGAAYLSTGLNSNLLEDQHCLAVRG